MRTCAISIAFSILTAAVLAGCGSSQPTGPTAALGSAPTSAAAPASRSNHFHATLTLDGQPEMDADGNNIRVIVDVTNDGAGTFGSTTEPNNVNLGAHALDTEGKVVINDLARGHLPQVAPGATRKASILLPAHATLGHSVALLPVRENVGWFDTWGTKPLVVGPFQACSDATADKVCGASGKPLPMAAPAHS